MNKNRLITVLGIIVAALALAGGLFMNYVRRNTGPEMRMNGEAWTTSTPAAQEIRYFTLDEIFATMDKNLEEYFPGRWSRSVYEVDDRTVVDVRFYSDTIADVRDLAVADMPGMVEEWDHLVESTRVSSGNWRDAFEMNQHFGYMVQFGYYDDADPDAPVFLCVNNATVLDPVHGVDLYADAEKAMAGLDYVPAPSTAVTYILNTSTKVFHVRGCGSAGQISADHRGTFVGDREDLIAQGYSPCQNCHP